MKPSEIRAPDYVAITSYAYLQLKTWADTTNAWTLAKIWSSAERQLLSLTEISPDKRCTLGVNALGTHSGNKLGAGFT